MSEKDDAAVVRELFERLVNQHDYAVVDELCAADYVAHSALLGTVQGRESLKKSFQGFVQGAPDFSGTIEDLFVTAGRAAVRMTYRGTDTGGLFGRAPSGNPFTMGAIYVLGLADGKVRELWQESDRLGLMRQIGALPET